MATVDNAGRTIEQAEDALVEAMRQSDVNALDQLVAHDLVFVGPDGTTVTKEADLAAHRTGTWSFERITVLSRKTAEHPTGVTSTVLTDVVVHQGGKRHEATIRYERSWVIRDGRWQVNAGSATVVPADD